MDLFRELQEYIALDASSSTRAILLTSLAINSCIPLKAIQYYIIIPSAHGRLFLNGSDNLFVCTEFWSDKNRFDLFSEVLTTKNRSVCADFSPIKNRSDEIQQWDLACHCHTQ